MPKPPDGLHRLVDSAADAEAARAVEQSMARLAEPGRAWVQASVWLRCHLPGLAYESQGVYLKAPGGRYRLETRTRRQRSSSATFLAVSDGRERWQATRTAADSYSDVRRLRAGEATPAGQLVAGVDPLLRSLQANLNWVRREVKGRDTVVVGVWQPALRKTLAPADRPWPAHLPRACRLSLRDDWPGRVEWWGPIVEGGEDRLLVELEFRDPVWGHPLDDEQCARLFAFEPGDATVRDLTSP